MVKETVFSSASSMKVRKSVKRARRARRDLVTETDDPAHALRGADQRVPAIPSCRSGQRGNSGKSASVNQTSPRRVERWILTRGQKTSTPSTLPQVRGSDMLVLGLRAQAIPLVFLRFRGASRDEEFQDPRDHGLPFFMPVAQSGQPILGHLATVAPPGFAR